MDVCEKLWDGVILREWFVERDGYICEKGEGGVGNVVVKMCWKGFG